MRRSGGQFFGWSSNPVLNGPVHVPVHLPVHVPSRRRETYSCSGCRTEYATKGWLQTHELWCEKLADQLVIARSNDLHSGVVPRKGHDPYPVVLGSNDPGPSTQSEIPFVSIEDVRTVQSQESLESSDYTSDIDFTSEMNRGSPNPNYSVPEKKLCEVCGLTFSKEMKFIKHVKTCIRVTRMRRMKRVKALGRRPVGRPKNSERKILPKPEVTEKASPSNVRRNPVRMQKEAEESNGTFDRKESEFPLEPIVRVWYTCGCGKRLGSKSWLKRHAHVCKDCDISRISESWDFPELEKKIDDAPPSVPIQSTGTLSPVPQVLSPMVAVENSLQSPSAQNSRLECHICHKVYNLKWRFDQHIYLHSKHNTLDCPYCGKKFIREDMLKRHTQRHEDALNKSSEPSEDARPTFNCKLCGLSFDVESTLKAHFYQDHYKTGPKTVPVRSLHCGFCGRTFVQAGYLKNHIEKMHLGEASQSQRPKPSRSVHCGLCGKTFVHGGYLKNHIRRVHSSERSQSPRPVVPVQSSTCEYCAKRFIRKAMLERHINRVHSSEMEELKPRAPEESAVQGVPSEKIEVEKPIQVESSAVNMLE